MSDERDDATDQPRPRVNDRGFVQDLLINDIEERKEFGIRKYGTALQSGNGRDMLQDAYEEVIDLAVYLRGMKDEDHHLELEVQRLRTELDLLKGAVRRYLDQFYFDEQQGARIVWPQELEWRTGWVPDGEDEPD